MGQDNDFFMLGVGMFKDFIKLYCIIDVRNFFFKFILFDGVVEGYVLVKNICNVLLFKSFKLLFIYGYFVKNFDENNLIDGFFFWLMGLGFFDYQEFGVGFFGWLGVILGMIGIVFNGILYFGGGLGVIFQFFVILLYDVIFQ